MKVFFFPSITMALALCLGVLIYTLYPISLLTIGTILLIELVLLYAFSKHKLWASILVGLVWINVGIVCAFVHQDLHQKNHYLQQGDYKEPQEIIFVLTERLKPQATQEKYVAQLIEVNKQPSSGKILVYLEKNTAEQIQVGSIIASFATLAKIHENGNPNKFSYAKYLAKQQIYSQVYVTAKHYKNIGIKKNLNYYANVLRSNLINSFSIHEYQPSTQQFINAFLLGQRQELNATLIQNYRQAGVMHILAISGLHVGVLYGVVLLAFKALNLGYKHRFICLTITLLFLGGFALLTGLSPSVLRCVALFSVIAITHTFNQNHNIYNAMALALMLLVVISPNIIFEVGFQLSYLAVLIIIVSNPLFKKLHFSSNKIINYVIDLLSTSFMVQLLLMPLLIYYFNQIPTLFLLANLVVIPIAVLTLYFLVIILMLNYVAPALSIGLGKVVGLLVDFLNNYVSWIAHVKHASIQNVPFNELLLVALYLILISAFILLFKITYSRVVLFLGASLLATGLFIVTHQEQANQQNILVWDIYKKTLITQEKSTEIMLYTNDTTQLKNYEDAIAQTHFTKKIVSKKIANYLLNDHKKIAVINSASYYSNQIQADYLILTQSPKVNLERIIDVFKPKMILCDGNNYKSYVAKWEQTCKQKKIPFYSTYKMGSYKIESN